jgi:hypothetical protein
MKQIETISFSPELVGEIKSANGELALVGRVPLNVVKTLTRFEYETLDLSRAVFEEEEEEYSVYMGYGHRGPYYGGSRVRKVDVLKRLLENVTALTLILPDDVARRHMTAINGNKMIFSVHVSENCKLFSMVGDDVYNKKKTTLLFTPRSVVFCKCEKCGNSVLKDKLLPLATGGYVCMDCFYKGYDSCFWCGRYFKKNDLRRSEYDDNMYCSECLAKGMG